MLGSGVAATKPSPAYMARGFHSISSSMSISSLLPVLLLSPSSRSTACGRQRFLCTSQRSVHDDVPDDEDDVPGIAGAAFLCASHLSTESARPGLRGGDVAFLCASHLSTESARPGLGGGDVAFLRGSETSDEDARAALLLTVAGSGERRRHGEAEDAMQGGRGLALCASHGSSESARLGGIGSEGMAATHTHDVGSSGSIFDLGGVGSSAGRAACSTARCTRATGITMDQRRIHRRARTIEKTRFKSREQRR
jgi:hypothetical protein